MKRILSMVLMALFICLFLPSAYAESNTEPDFKTFYWGDAQTIVEKSNGTPDYTGVMNTQVANYIAYDVSLLGMDAILVYYFCDDGLFSVRYMFQEEHSNEDAYIDDYQTVKSALYKKYGTTLLEGENWSNDDKKEYYANEKGKAVLYGFLEYYAYYLNDRTEVDLTMNSDNYDISLAINYISNDIKPAEKDFSGDL